MVIVRKAEELNSLRELELSRKTMSLLIRKDIPMGDLIMLGRKASIQFEAYPESLLTTPNWKNDLVEALDKAGFIRHDLCWETYRVLKLYSVVLGIEHPLFLNAGYEGIEPVTQEQLSYIIRRINSDLTGREAELIGLRFGLDGLDELDMNELAAHFSITRERARQIEAKALRKMRAWSTLPSICGIEVPQIDQSSVESLKLGVRSYNCLKRAGINTIIDLITFPRYRWVCVANLGDISKREIEARLHERGYDFNFPE